MLTSVSVICKSRRSGRTNSERIWRSIKEKMYTSVSTPTTYQE